MGSGYTSVSGTINTALLNGYIAQQCVPRYTSRPERTKHIVQVESSATGAATEPPDYMLSWVNEYNTLECYYPNTSFIGSRGWWRRIGSGEAHGPWRTRLVLDTTLDQSNTLSAPAILCSVSLVPQRQTLYVVDVTVSAQCESSTTIGFGISMQGEPVDTDDGRLATNSTRRTGLSKTWMWTPPGAWTGYDHAQVTLSLVAWVASGTGATLYNHTAMTVMATPNEAAQYTEWW